MRALIAFTLGAALAAAATAAAAAEADDRKQEATSGVISGEWGYVEVLPEAPPPGKTIVLREGWIRVESAPDDEAPGSGSFGVIHTDVLARQQREPGLRTEPQPGLRAGPGYDDPPAARQPGVRPDQRRALRNQRDADAGLGPCYEEREAYVEELFRIAGIEDIDHPLALLEGLNQTPGLSPWVRFNLFGIASGGPWTGVTWIEPLRPLAWDDGVQYAGRALSRCMREQLGFDDRLVDPDLERQQERQGSEQPSAGERVVPPAPRGGSL